MYPLKIRFSTTQPELDVALQLKYHFQVEIIPRNYIKSLNPTVAQKTSVVGAKIFVVC